MAGEPAIVAILSQGHPEVSLFATDADTGVPLKCRIDWYSPIVTLDLKTFTQMRGKSIDRSVADAIWYEGYYRQAFFYSMMRTLCDPCATDGARAEFVMAFVESDQPHETRLKKLGPKHQGTNSLYWQTARHQIRGLIAKYADCVQRYGTEPWGSKQEVEMLLDEEMPQQAY